MCCGFFCWFYSLYHHLISFWCLFLSLPRCWIKYHKTCTYHNHIPHHQYQHLRYMSHLLKIWCFMSPYHPLHLYHLYLIILSSWTLCISNIPWKWHQPPDPTPHYRRIGLRSTSDSGISNEYTYVSSLCMWLPSYLVRFIQDVVVDWVSENILNASWR